MALPSASDAPEVPHGWTERFLQVIRETGRFRTAVAAAGVTPPIVHATAKADAAFHRAWRKASAYARSRHTRRIAKTKRSSKRTRRVVDHGPLGERPLLQLPQPVACDSLCAAIRAAYTAGSLSGDEALELLARHRAIAQSLLTEIEELRDAIRRHHTARRAA